MKGFAITLFTAGVEAYLFLKDPMMVNKAEDEAV